MSDPDRYVLGPAVASGAEGILYRGWIVTAAGFELEVAIKMLQPRLLSQVEEWHTRWSEQVELLRSLQVPGVVRVRDGFVGPLPHGPGEAGPERTLYLVMNWVEGEPLDEWVRRRSHLDPFDRLKVLVGVAAALDLMHSGRATGGIPVVHRDVKPSNILVTDEGTVLVDFGLTRGLPDGRRLSGVTGTPGYLAPEASEAGVYSLGTDRYALGAVAYFVLTGREPPARHEPEQMRNTLSAIPALEQRPDAVDLLMAMLDGDPDTRPESLANWVGQLRRSSLSHLPEALRPEAPGRNPSTTRGRAVRSRVERLRNAPLKAAVVTGVAALLSLVLVASVLSRGDRGEPREESRELGSEQRLRRSGKVPASGSVTGTWRAVDAGPLATRGEPRAVWTGKEVLVVGGLIIDQYRAIADGAAFDPATETWRRIPPRPVAGRVMHATWTGAELITFGTEGIALGPLTTAAAFNPTTNSWRDVPLPPSLQTPSSAIWTGRQLLVWQPEATPPGALYDPGSDHWIPLPANSLPGAASAGRAEWTGRELAIQGSVTPAAGGPLEQRLFLFDPETGTWRVSSAVPAQLSGWLSLPLVWSGTEVILTSALGPEPAKTYAYHLQADRWRVIADPDTSIASAYFHGVRLDDGRLVVRLGNPDNPLQVLDAETGKWSSSGRPPGPVPSPDAAFVSTGSSVFIWGISTEEGTVQVRAPNAAWLWSP